MDDNLFEDLEKLFEECDDVTKTFYKSDSKDTTNDKEANCIDAKGDAGVNSQDASRVESQKDQSKIPDSDASGRSVKRNWKILQTDCGTKGCCQSEHESSREDGECTRTLEDVKLNLSLVSSTCTVVEQKQGNKRKIKYEEDYSSFIDSSKEDGECSTTSFEEDELETTIKAVSLEKADEKCSESDKENSLLVKFRNQKKERDISSLPFGKKRKRSLSEKNESTPKRHHLFVSEDVLSPISCLSADKRRNALESAETPIIESKFSLRRVEICSSTPVTREHKYFVLKSDHCSTPIASNNAGKQTLLVKKEILKTEVSSDSDSEFQELSDVEEINDKHQTVEELIAEITQLCEESNENVQAVNEEVVESSDKSLSKIAVSDLINEWKTKSSCESASESTDGDNDRTLTENIESGSQSEGTEYTESDAENLTIVSAVGVFNKDRAGKEKDESLTSDKAGRFKGEVTVSRIEEEKGNVTNTVTVDIEISDAHEGEMQYGDDLLNLNDYDDEGFVDENVFENSHLTKDLNLTVIRKEEKEDNSNVTEKGKKVEQNADSLFNLVKSLRDKKNDKTEGDTGLDYAAFDTSIYRKKDNTVIEKDACRRWSTDGSADPDVNLTVATTKRNRDREIGQTPGTGFLEGGRVVCTYLYEEEITTAFKNYGKTEGQSDLCYMPLENLIMKLYNQKRILVNMNKQSLLNIKNELEWKLSLTKERHIEELAALRQRQSMEDEHFRFNTRNQYNVMEFQNNMMQLRQEHIFQERKLREHHRYEYNAVRSHGMEILNEEVSRHGVQCEPINQLITQLEKPEAHAMSSPQKYGPPIVVSLRKGPCRASNGKHSTVAVCLSAGIAQAVSLEDDLYDHYYSYN